MKTITRILSALFALLLLPLTGFAKDYYTLPEVRAQVGRWQQTYTAHGREIKVDVLPEVPEADKMPMLEMLRAAPNNRFPEEEGWWIHPNVAEAMKTDLSYFVYFFGPRDEDAAGWAVINGKRVAAQPHMERFGSLSLQERYLPGNELTFAQICQIAQEAMAKIGLPEDTINAPNPRSLLTHAWYGKTPDEFLSPGWGSFRWEQQVMGIPISTFGLGSAFENYQPSMGANLSLTIRTPELFSLGGTLLSQNQMFADDLPLSSFDKVVASLEKEIMAGRLRHIFEIRLCYALAYGEKERSNYKPGARVGFPNGVPQLSYTVPVWVVEALWVDSPKKAVKAPYTEEGEPGQTNPRNTTSYTRLMVNAQTGELYDRLSKNADLAFFHDFISWDEAGGR